MKRLSLILWVCLMPFGVWAQETPPPYPEFTFKRVKPPTSSSGKLINVQVTPKPPSIPNEIPKAVALPPEEQGLPYAWYWSIISPDLTASSAGRLEPAVDALGQAPDGQRVATPRLATLQTMVDNYKAQILTATVGTRVSPALVLAVMGIESGGRVDAVSVKGATGLMQLMPPTAARFGVTDIRDPSQNIKGGVAYLDWLMGEFAGDPIMVLAAYNAGEGAVRKHGGVPPYSETRAYVPKVLAAWKTARSMCASPPELISDGCAFR